ncbi:hypothetical protein F8N00_02445 [Exiguobacterium sp. A1_3_1]|uniref:hypothetical protein n=1 Tax=Exiguobacterium sp. A1_3_1 TaxID=2651871 RepID=UPI003B8582E8
MISIPVHPLLSELEEYEKHYYKNDLATENWSHRQLYNHLILKSNEFLDCAEQCQTIPSSSIQERTRFGNLVFLYGEVPWVHVKFKDDFDIKSESNLDYPILLKNAKQLVARIDHLRTHLQNVDASKKIYHDELGWLNARDWLKWLDIHLHYHLRK